MRIQITNPEKKKSYDVEVKDSCKKFIRKKTKDEEICPECNKPVSECECNHEEVHDKEADKAENVELAKEDVEALKELIDLLPDLRKLLKKPSKEKKEEKEEEKEKDPDKKPEEKEADKDADKDLPGEKKDSDELELEEEKVILESDNNEEDEVISVDWDEDIIEDDCSDMVHDSVINPGVTETKVSDSNKDTVSHEIEVAEAWSQMYDSLLHK